jgi:hypothetical protein
MFGIRRPSVTTPLHVLEGKHFTRAKRNVVSIPDGSTLLAFAKNTYGIRARQYAHLIGRMMLIGTGDLQPTRPIWMPHAQVDRVSAAMAKIGEIKVLNNRQYAFVPWL